MLKLQKFKNIQRLTWILLVLMRNIEWKVQQKIFDPSFFRPKFFDLNFFDHNFFWPKSFRGKLPLIIFVEQKSFWTKISFYLHSDVSTMNTDAESIMIIKINWHSRYKMTPVNNPCCALIYIHCLLFFFQSLLNSLLIKGSVDYSNLCF